MKEKKSINLQAKQPRNRSVKTAFVPKVKQIRRYTVIGARRFSNYWWGGFTFFGGLGFLGTGLASYQKIQTVPILNTTTVPFLPQGLVMSFYGFLALGFSAYLWLTVLWRVGCGFNEFNTKEGRVRLFRWGFPGKNRRVDLNYPLEDIESIRVELGSGLNSKRAIWLKIRGGRSVPLTRVGPPLTLQEIERQASELARFLQVALELV